MMVLLGCMGSCWDQINILSKKYFGVNVYVEQKFYSKVVWPLYKVNMSITT